MQPTVQGGVQSLHPVAVQLQWALRTPGCLGKGRGMDGCVGGWMVRGIVMASASAQVRWDAQARAEGGVGAPLPSGAAAGPEVVKVARAQTPAPAAGVPPSRFLPAAFDRFLSVTTLRAWTPAQPHLV